MDVSKTEGGCMTNKLTMAPRILSTGLNSISGVARIPVSCESVNAITPGPCDVVDRATLTSSADMGCVSRATATCWLFMVFTSRCCNWRDDPFTCKSVGVLRGEKTMEAADNVSFIWLMA